MLNESNDCILGMLLSEVQTTDDASLKQFDWIHVAALNALMTLMDLYEP